MTQAEAEVLDAWSRVTPAMRAQVGAVLCVTTLALLPLVWLAVKRLVPARNVVFVRWGFSHVALALAVFLAASLGAQFFATPGASLVGDLLLVAGLFSAVAACVVIWATRLDPEGVGVLGWRAQGAPRAVAAGVLAYAAVLPGIAGLMFLWTWFLAALGHEPAPQDVAQRFAALAEGQRLLPVVLGVAIVPLLEELLFRAFLQPLLVQNFREAAGVGLTSFAFAALHGPDVFLPIFALSCLLGALMLRTQSLFAVWAVHALNNGLMFALLSVRPDLAGVGGGP
ncbi:MAG: CPBP family intramembrane metalloprotease [Planctomycetes bacterium]|nr:CPBP family intramembrane metalloprotease [Planctomycetota bacterium]